ncbi:unnamed protein product [Lactuca virosa]|uniref:Uncharacterized protein n=1 Tax=Lactuca virosa TaxID=75947 RepID=A0AAU9N5Q7_9ASTR|nr:unnamed protein product [Lactuca virosa]
MRPSLLPHRRRRVLCSSLLLLARCYAVARVAGVAWAVERRHSTAIESQIMLLPVSLKTQCPRIVDHHETLQICLNTYRWIQPFLPFLPQYIQFFHETETVQEMNPRSVSSIDEMIPIVQKHENSKTPTTSYGPPPPPPEPPRPPKPDLLGNRDDIHKFNVPVGKRPNLIGFVISENYDTTLHIATSANISKSVEKFVKNHVNGTVRTSEQISQHFTVYSINKWISSCVEADLFDVALKIVY